MSYVIMRCSWCNLNNPLYIKYHDNEWGVLKIDDNYLFEMLILECFQAGLSWECILNKRDEFCKNYDNFDIEKIVNYNEGKIKSLMSNPKLIRNRKKIEGSINNAKIFKDIKKEFGSFKNYLLTFFWEYPIYESGKKTSDISLNISKDLKKRGMVFVGSITIYSYLQAVGLINSHEEKCFLNKNS